MRAVLTILNGRHKGKSVPLEHPNSLTIGRGKGNDLIILDPKVSRSHCSLLPSEKGFLITDLDSTNGTYLNGKRITRAPLPRRATIRLGTTEIQFELSAPPRAPFPVWKASTVVGLLCLCVSLLFFARLMLVERPATVTINSTPSGALVLLDNGPVGATPIRQLTLARGPHTLKLQRTGFRTLSTRLSVKGRKESFQFRLEPAHSGVLRVQTEPAGALVHIDGIPAGKTPVVIRNLEPGLHRLRLDHPGRVPFEEVVEVKPTAELSLSFKLLPKTAAFYISAIDKQPNNLSYHSELANVLVIEHRFEEAMEYISKGLDIVAEGKDISGYSGRFKWTLDKIYGKDPLLNYGDANTVARVRKMLEETMEEAIERHPTAYAIYQWLSALYRFSGKQDRAVDLARKAAENFPTTAQVQLESAELLVAYDKLDEAILILRKADRTIKPRNFSIVNTLGGYYHRKYRKDRSDSSQKLALKYYRDALELTADTKARRAVQRKIRELGG